MNAAVELKEEISYDEFKAWMNGLVRGKGSQLPNIDDWRVIKQMMDKVVPDKETIIQHTPIYTPNPIAPQWTQPTYPAPTPWCDGTTASPHTHDLTTTPNTFGGYGCYGTFSAPSITNSTFASSGGYGSWDNKASTAFSLSDVAETKEGTAYGSRAGSNTLTVTDTTLKVSQSPGKVK